MRERGHRPVNPETCFLDQELPVGQAHEAFDEHGQLKDPELRDRLTTTVTRLAEQAALPLAA